jgi:hypothetical protein
MRIFSFDATFSTHDLLKQGITEAWTRRISLAADTDADAHFIAAQFAIAMHPDHMLTGLYWRI